MPINAADLLKRLKLLDTSPDAPQNPSQLKLKVPDFKIANSDLSSRITRGSEGTPYPTAGGVNLPSSEGPSLEIPSGLPESPGRGGSLTAASENRAPFKFGVPETGALGNVLARQDANSMGLPSSAVRNGAIEPPKMHHGFWDRVKSVGEGALMGMGQIAEQNARSGREQTLESLLGGGAAGGLAGGVSPLSIDALRNQKQADRDAQDLARQQGLEEQQADIGLKRTKPMLDVQRLVIEQQRADEAARRADQTYTETHRHNVETETERKNRRPAGGEFNITPGQSRMRTNPQTGQPEVIYTAPDKPEETPQQRAGRNADREAAKSLAEKSRTMETQYGENLKGLNTNLANIQQQLSAIPRAADGKAQDLVQYDYLKGELERTQKQIDQTTKDRNDAATAAQKAEADALKYDFGGSQAPQDPKVKEYADKFFGGNYAAAAAAIAKQRGQ